MKGLFAGFLVVLTCITLAQQKRSPFPAEKEDDELQEQRAEWFYGRRAFPLAHIPAGARLRALGQMLAMRSEVRQLRPDLAISNTTWTSIGPRAVNSQGQLYASGRVSALVVDPRNADTVYLGGADGGVWKSTDGGKNWKALTDNQPSLAIGALAIDLTNPDIVYAGTGDPNGFLGAGILKTTDAGNTWTNIPGPFEGSKVGGLVVHPTNGQILLAAKTSISNTTSDGIYRSTNGGSTWTLVQAGAGFAVTLDAAGNAYAALSATIPATPNGGVYRSLDSGATWTAANGAGATSLPWQNSGGIRMAVAPSNSATVYVSLAAADRGLQGVYKTTDSGATWNALNGVPDYCKPQCNYSNVLGVHPTDPNVLYAGGIGAVRTNDGGLTWSDAFADALNPKSDIVHVDEQAIAFAAGGQRMYLGSDGGVNSTPEITSNSILWTNLNATLTLTQFYPGISIHPSDTTIGFGGTQDNSTERYSGNPAWDAVVCGDGGQTAIDFTTPSTVYAACTLTTIQKSTDGGETWTVANRGIAPGAVAFIAPLVMDPSNSSRLYFGTDVINQTTNGAQTWTAISPPIGGIASPVSAIGVSPSDPNTVYAGTQSGKLRISRNALSGAGATWTDRSAGLPGRVITQIAVEASSPLTAYVALSGFNTSTPTTPGHVYKTTDGGLTWKDISANLPDIPAEAVVADSDIPNTLYLGTDLGVFVTSNGGTSWSVMASGLPKVAVFGLVLHRQARILRAGTFGRGMWDIAVPAPGQSPLAVLSSLSPSISAPGGAAFTLAVNGSGFVSSSTVLWNGSARATTMVNSGQLTAAISAADVASAGSAVVNVLTAPPGGGLSNGLPYTIGASIPTPTLRSVTPTAIAAGTTGATITVTGTNFVAGSIMRWNGTDRPSAPQGTTSLTATISAADIATAGTAFVAVVNPGPGGGTSNALGVFVTPPSQGSSLAGAAWTYPITTSVATDAPLGTINGVTADGSGNVYFSDYDNCLVYKLAPSGTFTVAAGTGICGGQGARYRLSSPSAVLLDTSGSLYLSDVHTYRVVRVNADATLTSVAGSGAGKSSYSGDGGAATEAGMGEPWSAAFDAAGNLFIATARDNRVRKVDTAGVITTVAGNGQPGYSGDGGPAASARLANPLGVATDAAGNVYIGDTGNGAVRKVTPAGVISTVAGGGLAALTEGGSATAGRLSGPQGVAVDTAGNLYVAESSSHRIRKVDPAGTIRTFAGNGTAAFSGDGGPATGASINAPVAVAADSAGNVYIADTGNRRVRKVSTNGVISTLAGNGRYKFSGDNVSALSANFNAPQAVAVDTAGNIFVADTGNNRVRRIAADGTVITVAGNGNPGFSGDGGPATDAQVNVPVDLAVDGAGNLFIADSGNNRIRKVSPAGVISTVAGGGSNQGEGVPAANAFFIGVRAVLVDPSGVLYVGDRCRVRRVTANGLINTVAGVSIANCSYTGDGGPATSASLNFVSALARDGNGNLFIAEEQHVRKVDLNGTIFTVAGTGTVVNADGSIGTGISLSQTFGAAADASGNLFFTSFFNNGSRVYLLSPLGNLTTVVGAGQGKTPVTMALNYAHGVALDAQGNLYIADTNNDRIVKVTGATAPAATSPVVGPNAIVNGASFSTDATVSGWAIASLFGSNLALDLAGATSLPLPTALSGASVLVNGIPAPLFFAAPGQINFQMPAEVTGASASVLVASQGALGVPSSVRVAATTPGIFSANSSGAGQGAVLNQDFSANSAVSPAAPGSVIQIFATGLGATNPAVRTGQPGAGAAPFNLTVATPVVLINGQSASVQFSAAAPGFVGLYQVNAVVPAGTPAGNATLQIQIGGRNSNTVTVAIK